VAAPRLVAKHNLWDNPKNAEARASAFFGIS
jgi:hypothetical protein